MTARPVIVELRHNPKLAAQATSKPGGPDLDVTAVPSVLGMVFDARFAPVRLPALVPRPRTGPSDIGVALAIDPAPEHHTYIVRATADEAHPN